MSAGKRECPWCRAFSRPVIKTTAMLTMLFTAGQVLGWCIVKAMDMMSWMWYGGAR